MLISIDWIKDFVELPDMSPKELGEKFTLATAEVEDVLETSGHLKKMCVAEIVSIEKHPEADKLNLVTFKVQDGQEKQVVCGASNVKVGLKTPFAPIGTILPGGFELTPKKIRGILSEGMLCSESELGLSTESSGIMELPADSNTGERMDIFFNKKPDILFDIDNKSLTHRPDLWGHYGMAREFSAIFGSPLKNPFDGEWEKKWQSKFNDSSSPVKVRLNGESACLGYFGMTIKGIQVGESPSWMQERLNAVDLRPINSIVDISNYVMTELGFPNHIFDRDQINGSEVVIKRTEKDEKFTTLDEIERNLISTDTIICDEKKTLVLGGIMGGLNSGVTNETNTIFVEVANWKAAEVRRSSTRLGLRTDSSGRYEKSLDSHLMTRTALRIMELIFELNPDAEVVGRLEYDGEVFSKEEKIQERISVEKINAVLGVSLNRERIVEILESLDFHVTGDQDLTVTVPTYRSTKDVEYADDIIEEIGRIIGYDNIEPKSPKLDIYPVRLTPAGNLHRKIQDFMVYAAKTYEVMTYPLVGSKLNKKADWTSKNDFILLNALSKDQDRLRDSFIPSFLEAAALNSKNFSNFKFFELGRSYLPGKKSFSEENYQIGILHYSKDSSPFMGLVNTVEDLLRATNIPGDFSDRHPKFKNNMVDENWKGIHPHEYQNIRIMGKMNGVVFSAHPIILKNFKIKGHVSIAILDITQLQNNNLKDKTKYLPLPKFPASRFDCTVLVNKDVQIGEILSVKKKLKMKEMSELKVLDVFSVNDNEKAVTIRAIFSNPDKTLDGDIITACQGQLISELEKAGFPLKS